jgi:hypothetical protein
VRQSRLVFLAIATLLVVACTTIAPAAPSPQIVVPLPGSSVAASFTIPSLPPLASALASVPLESMSPTAEPTPTVEPTATPTPTPKPTKKPTPTPSPTPSPIAGDIEVSIEQSSIPSPFYAGTDYPIRVYISALGQQDLPNVHVKLVAKDEGVSYKFDTGPIAITDSYYHDVTVNLPAYGPSTLILSATMPDGYADTNKSNNTDSVDITVEARQP